MRRRMGRCAGGPVPPQINHGILLPEKLSKIHGSAGLSWGDYPWVWPPPLDREAIKGGAIKDARASRQAGTLALLIFRAADRVVFSHASPKCRNAGARRIRAFWVAAANPVQDSL